MGMGRPLRIRLTDCDVEALGPNDLVATSTWSSELSNKSWAILDHCRSVAPVFAEVVKVSVVLGEVMDCQFSTERTGSIEDMKRCEAKLTDWYYKVNDALRVDLTRPAGDDNESPAQLYKYILNLYFQLVASYRGHSSRHIKTLIGL